MSEAPSDAQETLDDIVKRVMSASAEVPHQQIGGGFNTPRLSFTMYAHIEPQMRKEWLVRSFLGAGELSCFFGPPGSGKSVLVGDLGAHVSAGRDWHGRRVEQGGVIYVAAERGDLVKRRLAAFRKHHGLDDLPMALVSGPVDLRSNDDDAKLICDYAKRLEDQSGLAARLIIIDTVSRSLAGGDENSPRDMGAFIGNLGFIQASTNAHVAVVHHTPLEGANRMRGHGALLGACDTTVRIEKASSARTATVDKVNDGPEGERVVFDLVGVKLHYDPETEIMTDAPVVVPSDAAPAPQGTKLSDKQRLAMDVLRNTIIDLGWASIGGDYPSGVKLAKVDAWKEALFADGVLDREASNPRTDFSRITTALMGKNLIRDTQQSSMACETVAFLRM